MTITLAISAFFVLLFSTVPDIIEMLNILSNKLPLYIITNGNEIAYIFIYSLRFKDIRQGLISLFLFRPLKNSGAFWAFRRKTRSGERIARTGWVRARVSHKFAFGFKLNENSNRLKFSSGFFSQNGTLSLISRSISYIGDLKDTVLLCNVINRYHANDKYAILEKWKPNELTLSTMPPRFRSISSLISYIMHGM